MFIDKLIESVKLKDNPTVAGLDPKMEYIPKFILNKAYTEHGYTLKGCAEAIIEYNKGLIEAIFDVVPAVKPQLAYYEMYGVEGIRAFYETCKYAAEKGLVIIADAKRNDIGTTSEAYSKAFLGRTQICGEDNKVFDRAFEADALTVNPYFGDDGIIPFLNDCRTEGKGIFVLVKTSNKSSGQIQDLETITGSNGDKKHIYEIVAQMVNNWGSDLIGKYGYSNVGAVVGATYPQQAELLRKIMPQAYILVPGYGAQGGTAKDAARNFNSDGLGAIVNASRSIMCAYKSDNWKNNFDESQYAQAAKAECLRMKDDLNSALK